MIWIIALIILIVWFSVSVFIAKSVAGSFNKEGKIGKILALSVSRLVLAVLIFLVPFSPKILLNYYQQATMPFVCERLAGYRPYNPVVIGSIRNWNNPILYIQLEGVNYTEWQRTQHHDRNLLKELPLGIYRFGFFEDGASQCTWLLDVSSDLASQLQSRKRIYFEKGFNLKDTSGKCLGVQRISNFTYQYHIQRGKAGNQINSGFGYKVRDDVMQLIKSDTGEVVSSFHEITARSPSPFLSFLFRSNITKDCISRYADQGIAPQHLADGEISNIEIEHGFFE